MRQFGLRNPRMIRGLPKPEQPGDDPEKSKSTCHQKCGTPAEVAALLSDLNRYQQAELVAAAHPSSAVEALRQLDSDHREALLAELDDADRARLRAMLRSYAR